MKRYVSKVLNKEHFLPCIVLMATVVSFSPFLSVKMPRYTLPKKPGKRRDACMCKLKTLSDKFTMYLWHPEMLRYNVSNCLEVNTFLCKN